MNLSMPCSRIRIGSTGIVKLTRRVPDRQEGDPVRPVGRATPLVGARGRPQVRLTHTTVCNTIVCMQVERLSITMDPRLGAAVRRAAKRARMSLSAWIAEATADRVRNEALGRALDHWEAEDGAFTADELASAAESLGHVRKRKVKRR